MKKSRMQKTGTSRFWVLTGAGVALWLVVGLITLAVPMLRGPWLAGSIAAGATALGAVPALGTAGLPQKMTDTLYGFGAGVMLAAAAFALIAPSATQLTTSFGTIPGALAAGAAVLVGGLLIMALERSLPHEHFIKTESHGDSSRLRRIWLFVFAIALHNLPEGLAIGVSHWGEGPAAVAITAGIALQDAPEGLVVALALVQAGYSRTKSFAVALLTGLVEPIGAVLGAAAVVAVAGLIPWALALAGGAMLFVISHEVIPESHRQGHEAHATCGLMFGFVVMMVFDATLG